MICSYYILPKLGMPRLSVPDVSVTRLSICPHISSYCRDSSSTVLKMHMQEIYVIYWSEVYSCINFKLCNWSLTCFRIFGYVLTLQLLTELNTSTFLVVRDSRPSLEADLTAICEPIVKKMWESLHLTTQRATTACCRDSSTISNSSNHNGLRN
jgi:hypothetical protein